MEKEILKKEELFHDRWAAESELDDVLIMPAFETASAPENRRIIEWMGDLTGKRILELGAGLGEASVYFATKGAEVTSTDLSQGMLDCTQKLAARHGVTVKTVQASATDLSAFPDESFDMIYAANLLHHVDIEACVREVHRKLRSGGKAYFWDPIQYNPLIAVYRRIATSVRTEDEHPLRVSDLRMIRKVFGKVNTEFYWLTALWVFLKYYFVDRVDPNQHRYWKKILLDADKIGGWLAPLHRADRSLFKWIPGLKWLAWNVVIEAKK